jgi:chemotaxis protein MotB
MSSDKNTHQEIIIVKRRGGGHDEGHHGGVWKIAFADFMTAMMAFFLVLWIVNSTSKETRSSIARYFNPVQLADTTAARKGLREAKDEFDASAAPRDAKEAGGAPAKGDSKTKNESKDDAAKDAKDSKGGKDGKPESKDKPDPHAKADAAKTDTEKAEGGTPGAREPAPAQTLRRLRPEGEPAPLDRAPRFDENDLARDPQGALMALAGEPGAPVAIPEEPSIFADPFAPVTPRLSGRARAKEAQAARTQPGGAGEADVARAGDGARTGEAAKPEAAKTDAGKTEAAKPDAAKPDPGKPDAAADAALAAELAAAAKKSFTGTAAPGLEVKRTPEGLLISLTDKESFEMFAVGSSEPHPRLVALMGRVAAALAKAPGEVVLRGHTDARPFRGAANDNWRLSAARAAMARQMLLRGGLHANRVARLEGLAERSPRRPDDPLAAENRRIEILLRDEAAQKGSAR